MSKLKNKKVTPINGKKQTEKKVDPEKIRPNENMIYNYAYTSKEVGMVVAGLAQIKVEVSSAPDFINLIQRMQSEAVIQEKEFQKKNKK